MRPAIFREKRPARALAWAVTVAAGSGKRPTWAWVAVKRRPSFGSERQSAVKLDISGMALDVRRGAQAEIGRLFERHLYSLDAVRGQQFAGRRAAGEEDIQIVFRNAKCAGAARRWARPGAAGASRAFTCAQDSSRCRSARAACRAVGCRTRGGGTGRGQDDRKQADSGKAEKRQRIPALFCS